MFCINFQCRLNGVWDLKCIIVDDIIMFILYGQVIVKDFCLFKLGNKINDVAVNYIGLFLTS